jgi:hypothetical protein
MRCYICDVRLSPDEINYDAEHGRYDPCYTCQDASGTNTFQKATDLEILEAISDEEEQPVETQNHTEDSLS